MRMRCTTSSFEVDVSDELFRRPAASADYLKEKQDIQDLALRLGEAPAEVLPRFVELAMRRTGGVSAGLSIFEPDPAPGVFRWRHLIGELARFDDATTPRLDSPCGVTLDRARPVLMQHVERVYDWVAKAGITVPEVLLVPLFVGANEPIGTLWIVARTKGHFHGGHARIATDLASFVATALRVQRTEQQLQAALERSETLAHEMSHRVKNLFALVNTMIRFGARSATSKDDFAQSLSGRLLALASAHQLVLSGEATASPAELAHIIGSVIEAHQSEGGLRFALNGSAVSIRPQSISGVALVVNELVTNALKYGALASDEGTVVISWTTDENRLLMRWEERGGAAVEAPPERIGFGSRLLDSTIVRQFGGTLTYDWRREGVLVSIALPLSAVSAKAAAIGL
ncbi:sensor histidine kinase [Bosea eneae]|uniref:histidine kinase n=1 Tax=Bosea eneae TaxID=151454 RepID=A0ABW0IK09_9HYPH